MFQSQLKTFFRLISPMACLLLTGCWGNEVELQGYMEQEPIEMASQYAGELIELHTERGQPVTKGQLLFKLEPSPEDKILANAQNLLKQAQDNLAIAQTKASRFQSLAEKKYIDQETNDEVQTQVRVDKAQVEALQATVNNAQWALEQKTVFSPIDGQVLDTYFRPGEFIPAAKPVLALLDPKRLYAVFFVPETLLGELCMRAPVYIKHDSEKKRTVAYISYMSPKAEYTPPVIYSRDNNATLVFRIEATLPEADSARFNYGQPVEVYIPKKGNCHE